MQVAALRIDHVDLAVMLQGVVVKDNPFAVGRPTGGARITFFQKGHLHRVAAVDVALPYLQRSGTVGLEGDSLFIGGEL